MTERQYQKLVDQMAPKSPILKNCLKAFLIGGMICTIGQAILELYQYWGLDEEKSATATSMTLIALSALLTGLSLYDNIAKHGGAGTLVPITGFANAVSSAAVEFKTDESDIIGHSQKDLIDKGRVWRFSLT